MLLSATNACEKNCSETLNVASVLWILYSHYANMSVQYTAIFHGKKNGYFQIKNCNIFLIFAQVLTSIHNLCFGAKIRKKYTPVNPSFTT